jgi:arabinose-5-phosphate isomerase
MHGDLGIVSAGDLLLALSYSGETDELLSMLPAVKRLGLKVIAITGMADSRLARWSDLTLDMGVPREACPFNLAPTATTTALLALGDTLAMVLLDARGFGKTDYAKYHPAGAIGRSVTLSVTDIMRTGDRFPQIAPEVSVREALLAMTKARSGSVAVVDEQGRLFGIFTDGDFRRQVTDDGDVLKKTVGTVCTPDPITVNRSKMAVDVLKVVEQRNIDDVIVIDDEGRPLGLVDVQDLPSFKLM